MVSPEPTATEATDEPTGPTPPPAATPTPPADPAGGSLRFGLGDDPTAIDPRFAEDDEGLLVVDALFDSLTTLDQDLRAVPSAATRWEVADDGLTWVFTIGDDQRFHTGTKVVAADFVRAFNRIADGTAQPRSFLAHQLADVVGWEASQASGDPLAGLEAPDATTLRIRLTRPNADLAEVLAHPTLAPVPPSADEDLRAFGESPIGNGPFQMAEPWAHNQFIRVVRRSPDVALDEVLFRIYADDPGATQQYADFVAGQLQVAQLPASERAAALTTYGSAGDGRSGPGVLDGPRATAYHLGINTTLPPFDDPVVRRALSLLVDREGIATEVMLDTRSPATRFLPEGLAGGRANTCPVCRFDPPAALALLEQNGIVLDPDEVGPIRLLHNTGSTHAQVADRIASAIEEHLGLVVEVEERDLASFAAAVRAGEAHLFRHGWTAEYGTPGSVLVPLFHSRSTDNLFGLADDELDALLDRALATADRGERLRAYFAAEDRVARLMPIVPVLSYELGLVVGRDVAGFRMDTLGRVDLSRVRLVAP